MYKGKKIVHIVARDLNGGIGANNKLLWNIPEDMEHFKESTIGRVVLMGRNTFENLPNPLSRRVVLEVTTKWQKVYGSVVDKRAALLRSLDVSVDYCEIFHTNTIFVAGGSQLYNSTFDIVDELWVTQVEKEYPEADTFYHIPNGFKLVDDVDGEDCKDISYRFQKWIPV